MAKPQVTARDMQRALYLHFMPKWAVVFEVSARPEGSYRDALEAAETAEEIALVRETHALRRIDALLVRRTPARQPSMRDLVAEYQRGYEARTAAALPEAEQLDLELAGLALPTDEPQAPVLVESGDDGGLDRLAIEIKVSRQDFLNDVANEHKQAPWRELAHRHAYAVPAGLVSRLEVPAGSGLLEVRFPNHDRPRCTWTRHAKRAATAKPLPLANILDAYYRWGRAEALTRGLTAPATGVDGSDVEAMRSRLAEYERTIDQLRNRLDTETDRARAWRKRFHQLTPAACATCGCRLVPVHGSNGRSKWDRSLYGREWDHAVEAEHVACEQIRRQAALAEIAEQVTAGQGRDASYVFVRPPEPADPEERVDAPNPAACVASV